MKRDIRPEPVQRNTITARLDGVGFTASILCAVHCTLMPFVATLLPLIGLSFLAEAWVELSLTIFSIAIGIASLIPSYRNYHQNKAPLLFLIIGFALIFGTHFLGFHEAEVIFAPLGGLSVAIAHYLNWKLSRPYHAAYCETKK